MALARIRSRTTPPRGTTIVRRLPAIAAVFALACAAAIGSACGDAGTAYTVSVVFNDRYTDAAGQTVEDAIHAYDAEAEVLLQTSFPPVAHATVHTNAKAFCDAFRQRLRPRDDIVSIDCRPAP